VFPVRTNHIPKVDFRFDSMTYAGNLVGFGMEQRQELERHYVRLC
jgi:hypothetical protein